MQCSMYMYDLQNGDEQNSFFFKEKDRDQCTYNFVSDRFYVAQQQLLSNLLWFRKIINGMGGIVDVTDPIIIYPSTAAVATHGLKSMPAAAGPRSLHVQLRIMSLAFRLCRRIYLNDQQKPHAST